MYLTGQHIPEEITKLPEDIMVEALGKIGVKQSQAQKLVKNFKWGLNNGKQFFEDAAEALRTGLSNEATVNY